MIEAKEYKTHAEMVAGYRAARNATIFAMSQKKRQNNSFMAKPKDPDTYQKPDPKPLLDHKDIGSQISSGPAKLLIEEMCAFYGVTFAAIKSGRRTKNIAILRHKMMWVVRKKIRYSLPKIGKIFGNRDHTTVLNSYKKINELIAAQDPCVSDLGRWVDEN